MKLNSIVCLLLLLPVSCGNGKYALERNIMSLRKTFALKIENAEELVKIAEERKLVNQVAIITVFLVHSII